MKAFSFLKTAFLLLIAITVAVSSSLPAFAADKKKDYASYVAKREKTNAKALEKFITNFEETIE